jgi:molecular chaperone DnaK
VNLAVPVFDEEIPLGREEFARLAAPILHRTVEAARSALHAARVPAGALAGVYLFGGGSRIPWWRPSCTGPSASCRP